MPAPSVFFVLSLMFTFDLLASVRVPVPPRSFPFSTCREPATEDTPSCRRSAP